MNTILVCAALGMVASLLFAYIRPSHQNATGWNVVGNTAIGGLAGTILAMLIGFAAPMESREARQELAAIQLTEAPGGTFVVGTGTLSSHRYFAMISRGDGTFEPFTLEVGNKITFREMSELREKGELIIRYKQKVANWWLSRWALLSSGTAEYTYEFRVPVGTIRHRFAAN